MAANDPAYPPSASGGLPYPPADTGAPGALPYPPVTNSATNSPSHQSTGSENKTDPIQSKTYTDAPPPYAPPSGGTPYPGQIPPPQPGFVGYAAAQPMSTPYPPTGTVTVTTVQSGGQQVVVVPGSCPTCRVGMISENFSLLGICCAIWFFPLGLICCLAMRERRCTNCGAVFA